ncbi:hypothetical protein LGQ02_20985 [Bacillus shivajii]|uniref:hypothetical protein n=1 Tax=Bacillus shivajii TaxID=1983719 RepID=UPI001CFAD858|nr:hypothetical protein [Bacillus shivajii]UCZ53214.1 hypothetical protein LGQ02_20985 [Bacillus shivajii]
MFDTVKLAIPLVLSEGELLAVNWTKTNSSTKNPGEVDEVKTIFYMFHDDSFIGSPFIRYTSKENDFSVGWLKVEVSIPKFICGANVYELEGNDLDNFFKVLKKYLSIHLKVPLSRIPSKEQWGVEKVHVCKNFSVGNLVKHYLCAASKQTIPKFKRRHYYSKGSNDIETIEWIATKKKEKFYDKEAELLQKADYEEKDRHLRRAAGLLRYEIELSDTEIRLISPDRKAVEVLRPQVAIEALQKGIKRIGLNQGVKYSCLKHVINTINHAELDKRTRSSLIAFATEWIVSSEDKCRSKYSNNNFYKNKKRLRKVLGINELLLSDISLPPLEVMCERKKDCHCSSETIAVS